MIKITAEVKGDNTDLRMIFRGGGEEIAMEAVHIMEQLPQQLLKEDKALFLHFLAEIEASDIFGIVVGPKNEEGEVDGTDE